MVETLRDYHQSKQKTFTRNAGNQRKITLDKVIWSIPSVDLDGPPAGYGPLAVKVSVCYTAHMQVASPAQDKLARIGAEAIAQRIEDGATQAELAAELAVSVGSLNGWLHASPERSARVTRAMAASAEALADRGHQALVEAADSMAEIARGRALEQHWRWRAAIRNPHYRERMDHSHTGSVTHAIESLSRAQLVEIAAQGLPGLQTEYTDAVLIEQAPSAQAGSCLEVNAHGKAK